MRINLMRKNLMKMMKMLIIIMNFKKKRKKIKKKMKFNFKKNHQQNLLSIKQKQIIKYKLMRPQNQKLMNKK
jgi:hypothetical protein